MGGCGYIHHLIILVFQVRGLDGCNAVIERFFCDQRPLQGVGVKLPIFASREYKIRLVAIFEAYFPTCVGFIKLPFLRLIFQVYGQHDTVIVGHESHFPVKQLYLPDLS